MKFDKFNKFDTMFVRTKACAVVLFTVAVLGLSLYGTKAQDKKDIAVATPTPTPAPASPLALTPTELTARDTIIAKYQPFQAKLNDYWNQMLSLGQDDEAKAIKIWLQALLVNQGATPIRDELTAWFQAAQKMHNCAGCKLQNNVFVPEPLAGGAPTKP